MRLIGGCQLDPAPGDYSLLSGMFRRLPKEYGTEGRVARLVGYESSGSAGAVVRFLGIEVEAIGSLPEGLVAWELDGNLWTVARGAPGGNEILWREEIRWDWLEPSLSSPERSFGEFSARGPEAWGKGAASGPRRFSLFASVYVDPGLDGFQDEVRLADPDPAWPEQFERMARWLRERLGPGTAQRVEHYGSTAVPGLPAKPVVDILLQVPGFQEAKRKLLPLLDEPTWEYWWYAGHMVFFKRAAVMGERTHHLHVAPQGHAIWEGIAFRDHLRAHPGDAAEYAALKYRLAERHRADREGYTQAKGDFVQATHRKLRAETPTPA